MEMISMFVTATLVAVWVVGVFVTTAAIGASLRVSDRLQAVADLGLTVSFIVLGIYLPSKTAFELLKAVQSFLV